MGDYLCMCIEVGQVYVKNSLNTTKKERKFGA